jgi:hypothetical protein
MFFVQLRIAWPDLEFTIFVVKEIYREVSWRYDWLRRIGWGGEKRTTIGSWIVKHLAKRVVDIVLRGMLWLNLFS